ncbi:MAG: glycosyltransferase [Candidatus Krumholzibacteria bacterium]|jgi:glycosyltransferase involved in cell wall biosynthesis|nr:glycosyltransferase [Candidatus Krumholzibacteria bacterium]
MAERTICFFNSSKTWGGGEKWHFDMATRLDRRRWRPIVAARPDGELFSRLSGSDIPLFGVKVSGVSFLDPFMRRRIADFFAGEKVDTVIMNLPSDLKTAGPAAKKAGVGNIVYRRGSAIPVRDTLLNRRLFGRVLTGIIANSAETKRTILKNNPRLIDPERIEVIYNGIDLAVWDESAGTGIYQPRPGEIVIGNAGRLVKQKGQRYLLDLAEILSRRGLTFTILIAGEGPLKKSLAKEASRRGLGGRVIFTGFVPDMRRFMKSIDIFVLPSLWEGFGYVLVEAMASGKPVVAFNHSSNPEIIADGVTGSLAGGFDVESMADKVMELSHDRALRERHGGNGRRRAESLFSIGKAVLSLERWLDSTSPQASK